MSKKLRLLFLASIPLFVLHGTEEIVLGFYNTDSHVRFVFEWLEPTVSLQTSFLMFQLVFWAALVLAYLFLTKTKWSLWLSVFVGLIFIFPLHPLF